MVGAVVFWRDTTQIVGEINGVVSRSNVEFDITLPFFTIDGIGNVVGNSFTGEFRKWRTERDEYQMPHVILVGGGNFRMERKAA